MSKKRSPTEAASKDHWQECGIKNYVLGFKIERKYGITYHVINYTFSVFQLIHFFRGHQSGLDVIRVDGWGLRNRSLFGLHEATQRIRTVPPWLFTSNSWHANPLGQRAPISMMN